MINKTKSNINGNLNITSSKDTLTYKVKSVLSRKKRVKRIPSMYDISISDYIYNEIYK